MDPPQLDILTELASERLNLRAYRPGDRAWYLRMIQEKWDHLYEFLPQTIEE